MSEWVNVICMQIHYVEIHCNPKSSACRLHFVPFVSFLSAFVYTFQSHFSTKHLVTLMLMKPKRNENMEKATQNCVFVA